MKKLTFTPISMTEDEFKKFIEKMYYRTCETFLITQEDGVAWYDSLTAHDYKMNILEQKLLAQGADGSDLEEYAYMKWNKGYEDAETSHAESDAGSSL